MALKVERVSFFNWMNVTKNILNFLSTSITNFFLFIFLPLPCIPFFLRYNEFSYTAITNAALDLSPVLLGVLFTLVLLCIVIFAKVYCNRASATMRDLNNDTKHTNNISYKHDAQQKVIKTLFMQGCCCKYLQREMFFLFSLLCCTEFLIKNPSFGNRETFCWLL